MMCELYTLDLFWNVQKIKWLKNKLYKFLNELQKHMNSLTDKMPGSCMYLSVMVLRGFLHYV